MIFINEKEKTVQITVKISSERYRELQKLSAKKGKSMSTIVREFIDKGFNVQGYIDDIDFISKIIRQEVKVEIEKQANRICAMVYKIGTISAANYYLSSRALTDLINPSFQVDFKDMAEHSRKLGLLYMNKGVSEINKFLLDEEAVQREIDKISNKNFEV